MPAIWLFPREKQLPQPKELAAFLSEEIGMPAKASGWQSAEDDGQKFLEMTVTGEAGPGMARILVTPRTVRHMEVQSLFDEIIEQAEELKARLNENHFDVIVEFEEEESDTLAGCLTAYAFGSLAGCGMLVAGIGEQPEEGGCGCDGEHDHEHGHAHDHGGDDEDGDDEIMDVYTTTRWYETAEDFAEDFFVEAEDDDEDEEERK